MSNEEIDQIWNEAQREIEANHQVGKNFQFLAEEAIGNIAALNAINASDEQLIELLGKN